LNFAAVISFGLVIPFFYFLGVGDILSLFSRSVAILIPLIGVADDLFLLSISSPLAMSTALIMLFCGYPYRGWIDFYYRPMMMGKRVAIPSHDDDRIFAGVPFMGVVGLSSGLFVTRGYKYSQR
jgi:hypothetical protein